MKDRRRKYEIEKFWSKVDKNGPISEYVPDLGPCWVWTGRREYNGYGRVTATGILNVSKTTSIAVHRLAWFLVHGKMPDYTLDHLCYNTLCVNPSHCADVTLSKNSSNTRSNIANRAMTHCKKGHEYSDENTVILTGGGRGCRICRTNSARKRREERRKNGKCSCCNNDVISGRRRCRQCTQLHNSRYKKSRYRKKLSGGSGSGQMSLL